MKKLIALLSAAVMCLSLAACGDSGVNIEEAIIGDWSGDFEYQGATLHANGDSDMCIAKGHNATTTLSIFKGGAMQFTLRSNETGYEITTSGTWELSDGVLVLSYNFGLSDVTLSWEIDTENTPYCLNVQGKNGLFPTTLVKE